MKIESLLNNKNDHQLKIKLDKVDITDDDVLYNSIFEQQFSLFLHNKQHTHKHNLISCEMMMMNEATTQNKLSFIMQSKKKIGIDFESNFLVVMVMDYILNSMMNFNRRRPILVKYILKEYWVTI